MIPKDVVVHVNRQYCFSADKLFDAWIVPALAEQWLFLDNEDAIADVHIDARVGGRFSVLEQRNEVAIEHSGKYVEMERPVHLAFSLESPRRFTGVTYVSVFIRAKTYGSELSLTQTGVSPEKTEASWYKMLQLLENVLNEKEAEQPIEPLAHWVRQEFFIT